MDQGLIKAHPVRTMEGAWADVVQGVDTIR